MLRWATLVVASRQTSVGGTASFRAISTSTVPMAKRATFLGLDSSTQGLKATVIDEDLNVQYNAAINYDKDLPEFGTEGGVHHHDHAAVTTPTIMLAKALDVVLQKLKDDGCKMKKIKAVSGSGQQHGSVYWKKGAKEQLEKLNQSGKSLDELKNAFSRADSPIWMDSSTTDQCEELEAAVNGPLRMAAITGSRAYERFTANQILKIKQQTPEVFEDTEQISLISSYMCSLLLGDYANIDTSDGAGMNLMDLQTQAWCKEIMEAISPDLADKIKAVVPAHTIQGSIGQYFVRKYGFSEDCQIVTWSGDNPNSVAGLGLRNPGDVGLSLGTSDTVFSIMDAEVSQPGLEGHIFVNPVDPKSHMAMLCYKNGSLAREKVAKAVAGGDWEKFGKLIESTYPGNEGQIGFYFNEPEIIPFIPVTGVRRFDGNGQFVKSFPPEVEARAVLEGQMLSMRLHSEQLGLDPKFIVATGGASENRNITQIIANVFGTEVMVTSQPDSASLGAAYRALHAWKIDDSGSWVSFADVTADGPSKSYKKVAEPEQGTYELYTTMLKRYQRFENIITGANVASKLELVSVDQDDEKAVIRNNSDIAVTLEGVILGDIIGNNRSKPLEDTILPAGGTATIWTCPGHPKATNVPAEDKENIYWRNQDGAPRKQPVLNDEGDGLLIMAPSGRVILQALGKQ